MQRRQFLKNSALIATVGFTPAEVWMKNLLLPQPGNWQQLRRNISCYTNRGGTIGCLLTPDHCVVIDTQFSEQANELIGLIRQQNMQVIDLLINSHHHRDHTSGNKAFAGIVDTHLAHANSKVNQERAARENDQLEEILLPETTYIDNWSQRVGDETVSLYYFGPAHTDGDSLIHFEEANVVHTGDLVFNRRFPYVDKGAGADIGNWIQVLKQARKTFDRDTQYIFGHSGEGYPILGDQRDLKVMENFLKRSLQYVRKAKRKGQSLEDLIATSEQIPGAPEHRGRGIERVLRAAWEEVN